LRTAGQPLSVGKSFLLQRDEGESGIDLRGEIFIFDFFAKSSALLRIA